MGEVSTMNNAYSWRGGRNSRCFLEVLETIWEAIFGKYKKT